jgi:hypothetical protein
LGTPVRRAGARAKPLLLTNEPVSERTEGHTEGRTEERFGCSSSFA